jgi:hypothetical protein
MSGWIVQWKGYVPGVVGALNMTVCPPGARTSNWPRPSLVTVWSTESLLVTATVAPGDTVVGPVKVKFEMVMVADAAGAGAEEEGGFAVPDEPDDEPQAPAPASKAAATPDITAMRALCLMQVKRDRSGAGSIGLAAASSARVSRPVLTIRTDPVSNDPRGCHHRRCGVVATS